MVSLFLVRYPDEPFQITNREPVTIGRSENNTIVLTESRVSRRHAQIQWNKTKKCFMLSDIGSSNGTYLNGTKLVVEAQHRLNDWDKIRIAATILTARYVDDPSVIREEFKELRDRIHFAATEIVHVADLHNGVPIQSAFSGDLAYLCPVELFQMLETGGKTGILKLSTPQGEGIYEIAGGMVWTGRYNDVIGEQAVFTVLNQQTGSFSFTPKKEISSQRQIMDSTTMLLIEGCRMLDELNAPDEGIDALSITNMLTLDP